MPDAALVEAIRAVLSGGPFHGEGHRKVWVRPRMTGIRTSRRRVLRPMSEHGLLAPSRVGSPRGPRDHDGTIIPDGVDEMWGTDLTTDWTGEGQAAVFVAVDHRSAECVGIHAAPRATRFETLEPVRQGMRRCFGAFAKDVARGLSMRHGHGSRYTSDAFQKELAFFGIESSPAFVRLPEGNGCAECFIRTRRPGRRRSTTRSAGARASRASWTRWSRFPSSTSVSRTTSTTSTPTVSRRASRT